MENTIVKEMTMREIEEIIGCQVSIIPDRPRQKLSEVPAGETFRIDSFEFIVLEHDENEETTKVLLKTVWKDCFFDPSSNNYAESQVRSELNDKFYKKITKLVGRENIVKHNVDLTSDDGRKDYRWCEDYVSLLTISNYRKYVEILGKYNLGSWWWLATATSTMKDYSRVVRYVYSDGTLYDCFSNSVSVGVRPFCIFKSSISVF